MGFIWLLGFMGLRGFVGSVGLIGLHRVYGVYATRDQGSGDYLVTTCSEVQTLRCRKEPETQHGPFREIFPARGSQAKNLHHGILQCPKP